MKLENTFAVEVPLDRAWLVLTTPELSAACVPGLTLTGTGPDMAEGVLKVKLGTVPLSYAGAARYVERDPAARRFVLEATASDERGHGAVSAVLTGTLSAEGSERTSVYLVSDLTIGGRPAQFGRSVVAGVVDRMVEQFSSCVAAAAPVDLPPASIASTNGSARASVGAGARGEHATVIAVASVTAPPAERPVVSARSAGADQPIDPLGSPLPPLTKALITTGAGVLAALVLALVLLLRRGRR